VLKDDTDPLPQAPQRLTVEIRDIHAFDQDAPARWALQQVDHSQQRAFAGARTADDSKDLAFGDLQVYSPQGLKDGIRSWVGLAEAANLDHCS
jgi:hypothetical protein